MQAGGHLRIGRCARALGTRCSCRPCPCRPCRCGGTGQRGRVCSSASGRAHSFLLGDAFSRRGFSSFTRGWGYGAAHGTRQHRERQRGGRGDGEVTVTVTVWSSGIWARRVRRLCYPGSGQRSWGCVVRAEELKLASIQTRTGVRVLGDRQQLAQGKSKGEADAKAEAEAEAGLLLCADTRNRDATLLCTYCVHACTHSCRDLQAARTCGLVAERHPVCSCGSRTLRCGGLPFQKQRRALASLHLLTPEQLQLHARPGTRQSPTHTRPPPLRTRHAGCACWCDHLLLLCRLISPLCTYVDTCKNNARRNARFAERPAPSCCSIHNGRPARPSGLPI